MKPTEIKQLANISLENPGAISRRALITSAALLPSLMWSDVLAADFWSMPRKIWVQRRTPRGIEEYRGIYFADGNLIWDEYVKLCQILRDVRAGVAVQMSVATLDIVCGLQGIAAFEGRGGPFHATSGHRSISTNSRTEGAVKGSMHIEGRAIDGLQHGYSAIELADRAKYLRGGGVGVYPDRDFCHVDDGRIRSWKG